MSGFTKLSSNIVLSSIWEESLETKVVWITMLAMADADGFVDATIPGLAKMAGVSKAKTRVAIEKFLDPDPDSRTTEHEGRRIAVMDGGFVLLNHSKYRAKRDPDARKEYMKKYMRDYRAKNNDVNTVNNCKPVLAQAEAEAEAEEEEEEEAKKTKDGCSKTSSSLKKLRPQLFPITGKICSESGCRMPAVYHDSSGAYSCYRCQEHLPAKVKKVYG